MILGALLWYAPVVLFVIAWQAYLLWQKKRGKVEVSGWHIAGTFFLTYIFAGMVMVTGIPTVQEIGRFTPDLIQINWVPLVNMFENQSFAILNVIMFVPFGFLLPLLWKDCKSLWKVVLFAFLFSLVIEISQLFNYRLTDVDDLILNTLGGLVGYGIFKLLNLFLSGFFGKFELGVKNNTPLVIQHELFSLWLIVFVGMFFLTPLLYPLFNITMI